MQASSLPGTTVARDSRAARLPARERAVLLLYGAAAFCAVVLGAGGGAGARSAALLTCLLAAAGGMLPSALRRDARTEVRLAVTGLLASAGVVAGSWAGSDRANRLSGPPLALVVVLATCVVVIVQLLRARINAVEYGDRAGGPMEAGPAETWAEVAAFAATIAGGLLLLIGDPGSRPVVDLVMAGALLAGSAVALACSSVLTLGEPSGTNLGLLATVGVLSWAGMTLARTGQPGMWASVLAGLGALALGTALVVEGVRGTETVWRMPARFAWPWTVAGCAVLVGTALYMSSPGPLRGIAAATVGLAFAGRGVAARYGSASARRRLLSALEDKERAIASLLGAAETVAVSESRLRLLFDSAVDGVVEIDDRRTIVRANDAFCSMVKLAEDQVLARPWEEVAQRAAGGGKSLAELPATGEATLISDEGTRYLEARSSPLATSPPGSLLVVRDVTPSRVAEQTIRTLFQFLQDRDEDRSRLLSRTNAAIEAERNRIARDLHDGPIQGVSGATLSLEAVRLMMESGNGAGAAEMLKTIQGELAEEADSLRRVMGDLRPPVLEERGLVPAVRELCERFERERGTPVTVDAGPYMQVPADVETLAYRVVQESLSNVAKHARAARAIVRIETGLGTLKVEITDDGCGFDPHEARTFLKMGRVGLASMRERTELGGGTLAIRSSPGAGTTVEALLPFDILAGASRG